MIIEAKPLITCKSCGYHENYTTDRPMTLWEHIQEYHRDWHWLSYEAFLCPRCIKEGCK